MGLKDYRNYKRRKRFLDFLLFEFGVSEDDLKDIKNLKEQVLVLSKQINALEESNKHSAKITAEEKRKNEDKSNKAVRPQDIVKMFENDAEEFYPNGIGNN